MRILRLQEGNVALPLPINRFELVPNQAQATSQRFRRKVIQSMAVKWQFPLLLEMVRPSSGCLAGVALPSKIGRSLHPCFAGSVILTSGDACRYDSSVSEGHKNWPLFEKGSQARIELFDQIAVLAVKPDDIGIVGRRRRPRKNIRLPLRDAFTDPMFGENALDQGCFQQRHFWWNCTESHANFYWQIGPGIRKATTFVLNNEEARDVVGLWTGYAHQEPICTDRHAFESKVNPNQFLTAHVEMHLSLDSPLWHDRCTIRRAPRARPRVRGCPAK